MRRPGCLLACLLAALLAPAAPAEIEGVEFLGFGEEGPSAAYATGRWITARYRVRAAEDRGEPVNVILRRDDGATTVIANVRDRNVIHQVLVPLKDESWTLTEYEAFALEPDTGTIHQCAVTRSLIQVGDEGAEPLAGALARSRARLIEEPGAPAVIRPTPPSLYEPAEDSFDADLMAGADLDVLGNAL